MSESSSNPVKPSNTAALERATGRSWADWVQLFTSRGAASLTHPQVAAIALEAMPDSLQNPEWWAQGAAIAFEHEAGMRVPGQSVDGTFRVSANRTVALDRDAAIDAWAELLERVPEHRGFTVSNVRLSRTEKRSYWRATLDGKGAGKLDVAAESKSDGRSSVALQHLSLADGASLEEWKAHWKGLLGEL